MHPENEITRIGIAVLLLIFLQFGQLHVASPLRHMLVEHFERNVKVWTTPLGPPTSITLPRDYFHLHMPLFSREILLCGRVWLHVEIQKIPE